jgi:hypothetical protein
MAMPPDGPEAKFIVSRIVTGAPWTARQVKPEWATAGKLGTMFDKSYDDSLAAPFTDVWAQYASHILQAVGRKWWELLPPTSSAHPTTGRYPASSVSPDNHILGPHSRTLQGERLMTVPAAGGTDPPASGHSDAVAGATRLRPVAYSH